MGLDIQKDTGFNERLVTYLYALEVQDLVENGLESDLQEVQEAYDIPEDRAEEIVEASCKRYISQLTNLALRAAKKFDEIECMRWTREIAKFAVFVTGTVEADGNLFSNEEKERMLSFFHAEVEATAKKATDGAAVLAEGHAMVDKLRGMIFLTEDYIPPIEGIEGLLGHVKNLKTLGKESGKATDDKKRWAWGG